MSEDNTKDKDTMNQDPADDSGEAEEEIAEVQKEEEAAEGSDDQNETSPSPETLYVNDVAEPEGADPSDSSPNDDNNESVKEESHSPNESPEANAEENADADADTKGTDEDDSEQVKESNADEAKGGATPAEEEQDSSPVFVKTVGETEEMKSQEQIQEEKIQMATAAAKSAIAQQYASEETHPQSQPNQSETTAQDSPSTNPFSDPQLFPAQPSPPGAAPMPSATQPEQFGSVASSVPVGTSTVDPSQAPAISLQSSPHVAPAASIPQTYPSQLQAQMPASPQVSPTSQPDIQTFVNQPQVQVHVHASPRASPTPFDHLITPVVVLQQVSVPMQNSQQVSPASALQPGMQAYPQQHPMQVQTTPQASPTASVQLPSPVMVPASSPPQGLASGSPSPAPQPGMPTYPQLSQVSVQSTPQASPTSSDPIAPSPQPSPTAVPILAVIPNQAPAAPSPQPSPTGSPPVTQVQVPPQASPTSALSSPQGGSPKSNPEEDPPTESSGSPSQQPQVAEDVDSVADLEVGAKDQFHQDQFMEEFHTFQEKSPWEKFTYKVRNYTWREKYPILLGILLLLIGLILVIVYFAGESSDGPSFIISQSDQCQAVVNGNAIADEDEYPVMRLNWIVDVSTYQEWADVTKITAEVKGKFQSLVLPTLAGCINNDEDDAARAAKYKVVNGFVRNARDVGDCGYGQRRPCARIYINVALWMREETGVNEFLGHLLNDFGYEIVEELESSDMISSAKLVNIESFGR